MSEKKNNTLTHRGFEDFSRGRFDNGGDNLYVSAKGIIETIHRTDLNNDGYIDLVLPNSHGYIERGPTWIYTQGEPKDKEWPRHELANDSGWVSRVEDVDGDGYPDLIVVNGENGVTSELNSYVYWGGPEGLTGERVELPTIGAYDVATMDLNGDGLLDLVFPSAWVDHHNPGRPLLLRVYSQTGPRQFEDASEKFGLNGIAATSVAISDLNGNGKPDLVVANYRKEFEYDTDSYIYWGTEHGFDTQSPFLLPSHYAMQVLLADLNNNGQKDIIFTGGDQVWVYWNDKGNFSPDNRSIVEAEGFTTMFCIGAIRAAVADLNGEGSNQLVLATAAGVEIRSANNLQKVDKLLPLPYNSWVCAHDLNGDGRLDLIASKYDNRVTYETESAIFWNSAEGFSEDRVTLLPTAGAMGCSAGDLNGDGKPDVIFNNTMFGPSQFYVNFPLYVYLGSEKCDYGVDRRLELPTGGGCSCYVIADLNQDGYPDLIFDKGAGLRIFHGGADGPVPDRYTDLPKLGGECGMHVYVADFNRDGYLDILLAVMTSDSKPETLAVSSMIYYGSSEGFSEERYQVIPTYSEGQIHLADVTGNGYLDIICADKRGYVQIYLGEEDGYTTERVKQLPVESGIVGTINSADLTGNGYLDLIVGIPAFRARKPSGFCVFYGGPDGLNPDNVDYCVGDASATSLSFADLNNNGQLDLLVGAYSSATTRELPMQIFWGTDKGLDLKNPTDIMAESSCGFLAIDISGNGYKDVVVACHRNDLGHQVDSMIFWNGPDGLSTERVTRIPGMGPHDLTTRDPGNALNRKPYESYTSPPIDTNGRKPHCIQWDAEVPKSTQLKFQLRGAASEEELEDASWIRAEGESTYYEKSGQEINGIPSTARWLQYRAFFISKDGCRSAQLKEVSIDFSD
jgi:hypothetical protein